MNSYIIYACPVGWVFANNPFGQPYHIVKCAHTGSFINADDWPVCHDPLATTTPAPGGDGGGGGGGGNSGCTGSNCSKYAITSITAIVSIKLNNSVHHGKILQYAAHYVYVHSRDAKLSLRNKEPRAIYVFGLVAFPFLSTGRQQWPLFSATLGIGGKVQTPKRRVLPSYLMNYRSRSC